MDNLFSDKKKLFQLIGIPVLSLILGSTVMFLYLNNSYKKEMNMKIQAYEAVIAAKQSEIDAITLSSKDGLILNRDFEPGEEIKAEDISLDAVPDKFSMENIISNPSEVIGKRVKVKTYAKTILTRDLLYEDDEGDPTERIVEVDYIKLPANIKPTDLVDVRIIFPNGENYKVISKKRLISYNYAAQIVYFRVTEFEQHLLSSALYDANINNAEIYLTQYAEHVYPDYDETYYPAIPVITAIKDSKAAPDEGYLTVASVMRESLDARLKLIPRENQVRLGADAPSGSAVSRRRQVVGAAIIPQQEMTNPSTSDSGTGVGTGGSDAGTVPSDPVVTPIDTSVDTPNPADTIVPSDDSYSAPTVGDE